MACSGTTYTITQMLQMAGRAGYSGAGRQEIVAHALVESGGCDHAQNPSGAAGILQFLPSTAAGVGLTDPYNAQEAFDASYRLTKGSNFSDWTPYEPANRYAEALQQVKSVDGGAPSSQGGLGLTVAGTGLVRGKQVDRWGIGQGISDAVGQTTGSLKMVGRNTVDAGTVFVGLVVVGAGVVILVWLMLTRTDAGRSMTRTVRRGATAAAVAVTLAPK